MICRECEVVRSRKTPSKFDEEAAHQTKALQYIVHKVDSQLQSMKLITDSINELVEYTVDIECNPTSHNAHA